jgi:hypothetical protein
MEFTVCYTLENDIKREMIRKEQHVKKEVVVQEILEKINERKYFNIENNNENFWINTSLIRYIRVMPETNSL